MNTIPTVLHYLPSVTQSESTFDTWVQLHPNWNCIKWELPECLMMINTCYSDLLPLYQSYVFESQQIRLCRLLLLHRYGGIVVETRIKPIRSLESLTMIPYPIIYIEKVWMAAPKQSPLLLDCISQLRPCSRWWIWMGEWFIHKKEQENLIEQIAPSCKMVPYSRITSFVTILPPSTQWLDRYMKWRYLIMILIVVIVWINMKN